MPPVLDAFEASEIAKRMMQNAGFTLFQIDEIRQSTPEIWEVGATTLGRRFRMRINTQTGRVIEFVPEPT